MVVTQLKTPWTKLKKAWEGVSNTVQICSDEKEARFFQEANNRERWNLPWVYWNMRRYIDLESPRLGWKENLQETEVIQLVGTVKTMVSCRFPPCTNPLRQVVGRATPVEERLGGGVHVGDWGGTDLQIRWQTWAGGLQLNLVSWNMCWVWKFTCRGHVVRGWLLYILRGASAINQFTAASPEDNLVSKPEFTVAFNLAATDLWSQLHRLKITRKTTKVTKFDGSW